MYLEDYAKAIEVISNFSLPVFVYGEQARAYLRKGDQGIIDQKTGRAVFKDVEISTRTRNELQVELQVFEYYQDKVKFKY